jgi:uncharacterized protein YjbJ (UPF0337 family)
MRFPSCYEQTRAQVLVPQREFRKIYARFSGVYAGITAQPPSTLRVDLSGRAKRASQLFASTQVKETTMNKDQAAGGWKELKGKIKQQWGKLTDDDLTVLEGSADELSGRIQKRYGIAKEEAENQIKSFRDSNNDLVSRW